MASRRSRIKVLANIPLRRKTAEQSTNEEGVSNSKFLKLEEPAVKIEEPSASREDSLNADLNLWTNPDPNELNFPEGPEGIESKDIGVKLDGKPPPILNQDSLKNLTYGELNPSIKHGLIELSIPESQGVVNLEEHVVKIEEKLEPTSNGVIASKTMCNDRPTNQDLKTLPVRRKFLKPVISTKALVKRPKTVRDDEVQSDSETVGNLLEEQRPSVTGPLHPLNLESLNLATIGTAARKIQFEDKIDMNTNIQSQNPAEMTLDEFILSPQIPILPQDNFIQKIPKDLEYPPPPPSPNIINRIRKKAVPRLGYRKTSVSASESEDETRKGGVRIRNDSVCSLSYPDPSPMEPLTPSKTREINSVIQKKCSRTEQTRKLAEAKMEFQKRFGEDKPDRQKLTMMDLIFYNPSSNPMIKDPTTSPVQAPVEEKDETIDDPDPEDLRSDEENEAPVPQIKLGPSGEIIVDEKSLVVEQKQIKKQKERLQNTEIVDGDKDATTYGLYKRQKRGKNWTKDETLRFYKALNILGTDFGLMCDLFPNRTRKQLKMKFKKEEKVNKHLVDKAVTKPNDFSYSDLKYEVEAEQKEFEELEKLKREERLKRETKKKYPDKEKKDTDKGKKDVEPSKEDENITDLPLDLSIFPSFKKRRNKRSKASTKKRRRSIGAESSNSDADVSDLETQSESETDTNPKMNLKPTRYGRMPRLTSKLVRYEGEPPQIEKVPREVKNQGSLMVLSQEENEKAVYRVFLVTQNNREGENLLTITAREITEEEDEPIVENNITIPADETVSNLRTKFSEGDAAIAQPNDTENWVCVQNEEPTSNGTRVFNEGGVSVVID